MRDLKTLLELLLEEWELSHDFENFNLYKGLCDASLCLLIGNEICDKEHGKISVFIYKYLTEDKRYLFPKYNHNERVEWLKERIKELEK